MKIVGPQYGETMGHARCKMDRIVRKKCLATRVKRRIYRNVKERANKVVQDRIGQWLTKRKEMG